MHQILNLHLCELWINTYNVIQQIIDNCSIDYKNYFYSVNNKFVILVYLKRNKMLIISYSYHSNYKH